MADAGYFSINDCEQYVFYRIPKMLISNPKFEKISFEAKFLYGILLDRQELSKKNGWADQKGHVFIIYTIEEIMRTVHCSDKKAIHLLKELEGAGLLEKKRQGLGKPSLLYLKNFTTQEEKNIRFRDREFYDSGDEVSTDLEPDELRSNDTERDSALQNHTEDSEIHSFSPEGNHTYGSDLERREGYRKHFLEDVGFSFLPGEYPEDADLLEEMLELLVETCSSRKQRIRIGGEDKPASVVTGQLMKLTADHIRYVLKSLEENTTRVKNMRTYLLTALYNAPFSMNHYYSALYRSNRGQEEETGETDE